MHRMGRRHRTHRHYQKIPNPLRRASLRALDGLDVAIYVVVGTAFVVAALMALVFSISNLGDQFGLKILTPDFGTTVLNFVSDLLLVLIILEVLGTIRSYLEHGDTSVKPFIFIGIISATRGILSIGARLSIAGTNIAAGTNTGAGTNIAPDDFRNSMIELGINAAIIIALGSTLRIMGNAAEVPDEEAENDEGANDEDVIEQVTVTTTMSGGQHHGIDRQADTLPRTS